MMVDGRHPASSFQHRASSIEHPASSIKYQVFIGLIILLLAAVLRFGAFDEALVGGDQSSILTLGREIAALRRFPLTGMKSSLGPMQTALTPYLAALPLVVVQRVIAVKWFFSALDLLAVALLYVAVRRAFGPRAAVVAGLLYAANPWVVEFVRWIWYQSLIPTFATVAFSSYLLALAPATRRRDLFLALGLLGAALMGMVHLAAAPWAALLVVVGLVIAAGRGLWRGFAAGMGLSLLVAFPYLYYFLGEGLADLGALGEQGGLGWNPMALRLTWELLTGREVLTTPRDPLWAEAVVQLPLVYTLVPVLIVLAVVGAIVQLLRQRGRDASLRDASLVLSLGWSLLAPLVFAWTSVHLQHYYLLFVFPAPYVLLGAWIETILPSPFEEGDPSQARAPARPLLPRRVRRLLGAGALVAVLVVGVWWSYLWMVRIGYESRGRLRAPTRAWLMDETVEVVRSYLEGGEERAFIILTDFAGGVYSPFDWVGTFVDSGAFRAVPLRAPVVPRRDTCYLLGPGASVDALAPIADRLVHRPELTVPASPPWEVYCIQGQEVEGESLVTWANGMALMDARVEGALEPGGRLRLIYTWYYEGGAGDVQYHVYNHLWQGEEVVAQVDGTGLPSWLWREGDTVFTRFELDLPPELAPGSYQLRMGLYTWPALDRVLTLSGDDGYVVERWTR